LCEKRHVGPLSAHAHNTLQALYLPRRIRLHADSDEFCEAQQPLLSKPDLRHDLGKSLHSFLVTRVGCRLTPVRDDPLQLGVRPPQRLHRNLLPTRVTVRRDHPEMVLHHVGRLLPVFGLHRCRHLLYARLQPDNVDGAFEGLARICLRRVEHPHALHHALYHGARVPQPPRQRLRLRPQLDDERLQRALALHQRLHLLALRHQRAERCSRRSRPFPQLLRLQLHGLHRGAHGRPAFTTSALF